MSACVYMCACVYSGIDYNHPDFGGRIDVDKSVDYIDSNGDGMDYNGHGTHVAGNWKLKCVKMTTTDKT